jgi:hypothetical protein
VAVGGADAVGAGVAAADHDDVLALDVDRVGDALLDFLVLRDQELQRGVDALQLAARDRQVAGHFGAGGEDHRVEIRLQLVGRDGFGGVVVDAGRQVLVADQHLGTEGDALGLHLLDAAVDDRLVELEVGDAEAEQTADAAALLEHRDVVADAGQLLGRRQAGGAGTDDGDLLAGLGGGRLRHDPAVGPGLVDDRVLDRLDAHRVGVDVERAGGFAGRRADAAGEVGKLLVECRTSIASFQLPR